MYKIVRMYFNSEYPTRTIASGLTLQEAQEHCKDPESSSRTAVRAAGKHRTRVHGPWFDGYQET